MLGFHVFPVIGLCRPIPKIQEESCSALEFPFIGGKSKPHSLHSFPGKNLSAGIAESTHVSGPIYGGKNRSKEES